MDNQFPSTSTAESTNANYYETYLRLLLEKNSKEGKTWQSTTLDMIDCVNLFQCLGFRLRRIDAVSKDNSPLRGGDKGVRMVITCGHSGQRCFLEYPTLSDSCSCSTIPENNNGGDGYWEVTASKGPNKENLVETGCYLIPPLPKHLPTTVNTAVCHLIEMMRGKHEESTVAPDDSLIKRNNDKYSPMTMEQINMHRLIDDVFKTPEHQGRPVIVVTAASNPDTLRYRSLDSLRKESDDNDILQATPLSHLSLSNTKSTPNVSSVGKEQGDVHGMEAYEFLENASQNLLEAIKIFKSLKNPSRDIKAAVSSTSKTYKLLMENLTPKRKMTPSKIPNTRLNNPKKIVKAQSTSTQIVAPKASLSTKKQPTKPTGAPRKTERPRLSFKKDGDVKKSGNETGAIRRMSLPASALRNKSPTEASTSNMPKLNVPVKKDLKAKVMNKNVVIVGRPKAEKK